MKLYFVTGNKNKYEEAKQTLPFIQRYTLETTELQTLDKKIIVQDKLRQAKKHLQEPFFLEDASLDVESLNGLPGPFVKFFAQKLSAEQFANLCLGSQATAACTIGYWDGKQEHILTGETKGVIVQPRGEGWGFSEILEVEDTNKTLAQLHQENNYSYTHRTRALKKLQELL
ncbi:MAG: non-canonical purine NTP pyrophosphatase [Candidatus Woesearchaeota archaeon]